MKTKIKEIETMKEKLYTVKVINRNGKISEYNVEYPSCPHILLQNHPLPR